MMAAASTAAAQTASANGILRTLSLAIIRPVPPGNGSRSFKEQAGYRRPAKTSPRLRRKLPRSCARTIPPYRELTCLVGSALSATHSCDRVFACTAGGDTIQTSYGTNCVGVLGADAVLVIDPLISPAFARQVQAAVRRRTNAPVRFVAFTHHHTDHTWGASVFAGESATIVAHRACRERMDEEHPAILESRQRQPEHAELLYETGLGPHRVAVTLSREDIL